MGHCLCRLHIIMSLLAVVFMSILGIAVGGHANCNPLMHDCSCGDKSFDQCNEPNPAVSIHVTDLNECILNCDLFATFGQCDWLVYFNHGPDENCHLHAQGETMEEYLYTCNTVGQPTRYQDGHCMTDYAPVCNVGLFCNEGCRPCDKLEIVLHSPCPILLLTLPGIRLLRPVSVTMEGPGNVSRKLSWQGSVMLM